MEPCVVGIDIGKATLDVNVLPTKTARSFANTLGGCEALVAWLVPLNPERVVLEAGGPYGALVVKTLARAGLPVARVNPCQARHFAKATGRLAKTDLIDAGLLAAMGQALKPRLTPPASQAQQDVAALVTRRRQCVDMCVEGQNRLESTVHEGMRAEIRAHVQSLKQKIAGLDQAIATAIKAAPELEKRHAILVGVSGIGDVTAAVLVAELPELGHTERGALASLVGVAPHNHDSGTLRGPRHIRGGRFSVRCSLYMATLSAIRHHPTLKVFYKRLRDNGKPAKVAIVAAMRKYVIILNAVVRDQEAATQPLSNATGTA